MSRWKAFFAGDVVLSDGAPFVEAGLAAHIREHDLASCNFEAPVVPAGAARARKVGSWLSQPAAAAARVLETGFNVIHLANNHLYDFGEAGLEATLASFASATVLGAGRDPAAAGELRVREVRGVRVGLFGYGEAEFGALVGIGPKRGGFAWVNHPAVDGRIEEARRSVDVLLVQVHAGVEEVRLPLPEWRARFRRLVELGADAVIAHHPHVPQGWEVHRGKPIFHSLGNFAFDPPAEVPLWNRGYAVSLEFEGASLLGYTLVPTERTAHGVAVCADPEYARELAERCAALQDERYEQRADEQAIELWRSRYRRYYRDAALGLTREGLPRALGGHRGGRAGHARLMLLHNIQIESHRWTVQRALTALVTSTDPGV